MEHVTFTVKEIKIACLPGIYFNYIEMYHCTLMEYIFFVLYTFRLSLRGVFLVRKKNVLQYQQNVLSGKN